MKSIKEENHYSHKYEALLHVFRDYAQLINFENANDEDLIEDNEVELELDITLEKTIEWWDLFKKVQKGIIQIRVMIEDMEKYGYEIPDDFLEMEFFDQCEWIRDVLIGLDKLFREATE